MDSDGESRVRGRLRWLWPSLALGGFLASAVLSMALMRKPPAPMLLPTAPPERDVPVVHTPERTTMPTEKVEAAPVASPPSSKPARASSRKPARAKKRARVTPRAG